MTLEKVREEKQVNPKGDEVLKSPENLGPNCFKELEKKQISISRFVVALEKKVEEKQRPPAPEPKPKPPTPVRTKVWRLEEISRSPGLSSSLVKVSKMRNKPGNKIQSTIKKFLIADTEAEDNSPSKRPLWPGACGKPVLAKTSRPGKGTLALEGGKYAKVKKREGIGPRPLDRWLLAGSDKTKGSAVEAGHREELKGRVEPQRGE